MDVSDDLRAVRDFIQALLKSKKTIRMYPDNNPIYRKTLDDTFSKVSDILDYREDLSFKIKQNEIFLDSEQVYHNPEKDDNLALFFFKDGLRELSFTKGLSIQELEEFLKIITLDFDREAVDDDIVTLLWEKDFHHIKYVADEAFLAEDEDYESKAVQEVKSKAATTDDVLKAYADAFDSEDVKEISIVNLSDKDLQYPLAGVTPVIIGERADVLPSTDVLINLGSEPPPVFSRFERLVEIVTEEESDVASGRQRYRFYKDRGYELVNHDWRGNNK